MSKKIVSFRDESHGMFIDLADRRASVSVDFATGDVLLNEGEGEDCYQGAVIDPAAVGQFELEPELESARVVLQFGEGEFHVLGSTHDLVAAQAWVNSANGVLRKYQLKSSARREADHGYLL